MRWHFEERSRCQQASRTGQGRGVDGMGLGGVVIACADVAAGDWDGDDVPNLAGPVLEADVPFQ